MFRTCGKCYETYLWFLVKPRRPKKSIKQYTSFQMCEWCYHDVIVNLNENGIQAYPNV